MKKNKSKILSVIAALIVFIAIFSIKNNSLESTEDKVIKLGLISPLSGEYAAVGQNYQRGIELAFDEYKKNNPNQKIELTVEDDGFDVKKGISVYKKLTDINHVNALMMLSTPVIDAIYGDITKTDLIVMQLGIQTKGIAPDNIFQTSPLPDYPISEFTKYLNNKNDFKKIAVVYDNTAGGISFYEAFQKEYKKDYIPLIVNNKSDLRSYATKISKDEDIDSVLFLTSPDNGALLVKDIITFDKTIPTFAFDPQLYTGYENYRKILGDMNKINGSLSLWLKEGDSAKFKELYKAKYGEEPSFLADFGYDTFNVLMKNYNKDHITWMKNIQDYNDKNGVSGSISFDKDGVRVQDIVINKIVNGEITPIE